jgi:ubiquitin-conjugating enzyme E2 W
MVVRWVLLLILAVAITTKCGVHCRNHNIPHIVISDTGIIHNNNQKWYHRNQFDQVVSPILSFSHQKMKPQDSTNPISTSLSTIERHRFDIPRGGGGRKSNHGGDDIVLIDNNDSFIVQKVKNIIRSIMNSTKNSPILHDTVSSLIHIVESLSGITLLQEVSTSPTKDKKKKRKKKVVTTEPISKDNLNDKNDSTVKPKSEEQQKKVSAKTKKTSPSKPSAIATTTSMQIKKDLKATNPNYRIQQELKSFLLDPPEHLKVKVGKNIRIWVVVMEGVGIYTGETFRLRIQFPPQYPTVPPSVYFLPPNIPIHEHVYTNGDICLSLLGKDWRPTMTAQSIAHSIVSILHSATSKSLPMDNARHAGNQPGQYQENWVYHDDNC